ncbi:MAG: hypothetical protein ATN36_02165 [Epulopiscium sp. Nele67-Bin005]|nr:MAG: hypothetical protein ATN36_02165 [Epulopiscium sp. Nele67-Bin005]
MNKKFVISAILAGLTLGNISNVQAQNIYPSRDYSFGKNFAAENSNLDISLYSRFNIGTQSTKGGLIEIVAYNSSAQVAYATSGVTGEIIVVPMNENFANAYSGIGYNMEELVGNIEGFEYGDMSSIAVNSTNTQIAVALQANGFNDNGKVVVFELDNNGFLINNPQFFDAGKQPDNLIFTPDGTKILVANEGEPRNGMLDIDPEGSVTIIDLTTNEATNINFDGVYFDEKVLLQNGKTPSEDFEPEYIVTTNDTAYVALQENNAIAILDINTNSFKGVYGLGLQDFGKVALDLEDDGEINIKTFDNVYGVYMPDGIELFELEDKTYILTANEGDGREWGEEDTENFYTNEHKSDTSPTGNVTVNGKVTWFNPADYEMLDQSKAYLYGSRSFSIFEVTDNGMELVFDSGSGFEIITAQAVPEHFNSSNTNSTLDDRSGKKGPEPEDVKIGQIGENIYAFVGLERVSGVMVYNITDPHNATFTNYFTSRDYTSAIGGDVSPEGLKFVPKEQSPTGTDILLVANEGSGTLAVYELIDLQ